MSIKVFKTKKPKRTDLTGLVNAELARNREDFKHEEGKKLNKPTFIVVSYVSPRIPFIFAPNEYTKERISEKQLESYQRTQPCYALLSLCAIFLDLKPAITTP